MPSILSSIHRLFVEVLHEVFLLTLRHQYGGSYDVFNVATGPWPTAWVCSLWRRCSNHLLWCRMFVSPGRYNPSRWSGHVPESIAIEITDSAPDMLRPSWGLTVQHIETVEIQERRTVILKFLLCMSTLTLGGGSAVSRNNHFPRRSDTSYSRPVDLKISTDATNPQWCRKPHTKILKIGSTEEIWC